jgi:hypothetical protein
LAIPAVADRGLRNAVEQRCHFAARAAGRVVFEQLPAGIHERDDDPGQRLADRKRARHRHCRDDVETDAAPSELGHDFEQQRRKDQKRSPAPNPGCKIALLDKPCRGAEDQASSSDCDKCPAQNGCDAPVGESWEPCHVGGTTIMLFAIVIPFAILPDARLGSKAGRSISESKLRPITIQPSHRQNPCA